ncbi:MAG: photoactive yellow protein [Pseudomonadota bacterium]
MEILPFGSNDIDNILQREPHRAESLPFGAVLVDRKGTIQKYNAAEAYITKRDPQEVIGQNFFNDIAPCAKGKRFHGEFLKFRRAGHIDTLFDYEFDYKMERVRVKIHLKSQDDGQSCWIFVKRA